MVVCAGPDYLKNKGRPLEPEELKIHECLCNSNLAAAQEWRFIGPDGQSRSVMVKGRLTANNGDALRVAALKNFGIIYLPTFIVGRDLQSGALASVLDEFVPQNVTMNAVYPHAKHLSPKVRAFVDFLAELFGPRPYWDLID